MKTLKLLLIVITLSGCSIVYTGDTKLKGDKIKSIYGGADASVGRHTYLCVGVLKSCQVSQNR